MVVADAEGRRYQLPLWMTLPEAARWEVRKRSRLSLLAPTELRDLMAAWSAGPALPATENRDGIQEAGAAAEGSGGGAKRDRPERARRRQR